MQWRNLHSGSRCAVCLPPPDSVATIPVIKTFFTLLCTWRTRHRILRRVETSDTPHEERNHRGDNATAEARPLTCFTQEFLGNSSGVVWDGRFDAILSNDGHFTARRTSCVTCHYPRATGVTALWNWSRSRSVPYWGSAGGPPDCHVFLRHGRAVSWEKWLRGDVTVKKLVTHSRRRFSLSWHDSSGLQSNSRPQTTVTRDAMSRDAHIFHPVMSEAEIKLLTLYFLAQVPSSVQFRA